VRLRGGSEWRFWAAVAATLALLPLAVYAAIAGGVAKTEIALGVSRGWAIAAFLAVTLALLIAFFVFDRADGADGEP
jgi:hypothetical protein